MREVINGVASEYEMPREPKFYEKPQLPYINIHDSVPEIKIIQHDCKTLNYCVQSEFEDEVTRLLEEGYTVSSSSCNSSKSWKAIMIR